MEYITIKHGTEQTTNVHKNVFNDIIDLLPEKINNIKIENPKIVISKNNNNVDIYFNYTVNKNSDLYEVTANAKKWINETIFNLIDFKPNNILMNYQGRY